ncbi:MAG: hypothetical protein WD356_08180 [Pseudomonadales bacterium]
MTELTRLHDMIESLKRVTVHEGLDSLMNQLASLEIEAMALTATARRHERALEQIVQVKLPELKRQVCLLGLEVLGYYALPHETRDHGDNEPPIGPDPMRELRAQVPVIFNSCFAEADISEAKDRLAEILASGSRY